MNIVIHRGTHQIGGSCIELSEKETSILLDLGLPLDFDSSEDPESCLPQPLFEQIKMGTKTISAVILTHAHLDHYGLIDSLPKEIPVYCGAASAELMLATWKLVQGHDHILKTEPISHLRPFSIGPFTITPYLMDHSAFDAYGLLVKAGKKSIFYTGDFRAHGRKAKLFDRLLQNPPKVDALLMEGSLIGERSNEKHTTENELENRFVDLMNETDGIVLLSLSSQNIDRIVTIFKAAKRTSRMLIIDFYTAEILRLLEPFARIPQATWPGIRVCYPWRVAQRFEKMGQKALLDRHRKNGIRWTRLNEIRKKAVMMVRPGFLPDIKKHLDLEGALWIYSMWSGYLKRSDQLKRFKNYLDQNGVRFEHIHTSGHATISSLKRLVEAIKPDTVIPIHSFHLEQFAEHFPNVRMLDDGNVSILD